MSLLVAWWAPRLWLGSLLLGTATGLTAALVILLGNGTAPADLAWTFTTGWSLGGENLSFHADPLSAWFLALLCVIGGLGGLYGASYWTAAAHPFSSRIGRLCWSGMVACIAWVLACDNGLHFLIAWEAFTLFAYFLISLDRQRAAVRHAGWLYLGASHVAALALFAYFTLLATHTGGWALGPQLRTHAELAPLFWLALFGFGLKAGMFPLHIWLPSAHANAPSHVSALMSGVSIKLGIYGLLRFSGWLPVPDSAPLLIIGLGLASAVLGVAFALGQHDLKRLLAYHSVENIGIILLGVGFALLARAQHQEAWGLLGLAGALLHVWNHGLFKALLFLGAGSVLHATGTREMSRLGGLWRRMPITTVLFALGAAAIIGLPPLNGFVSEWLLYLGLFDATLGHSPVSWVGIPSILFLAITGALALACFAKVCGVVFLGAPRSPAAEHAHESPRPMLTSMLLLGLACAAIGLAPALCWPLLARVLGTWNPAWTPALAQQAAPVPLLSLGWVHVGLCLFALAAAWGLWRFIHRQGLPRRAPTWDCGYAAPTPRMQYTAGSFAGILTEWFAFILRPTVHSQPPLVVLPSHALHRSHTPETVLDHVVLPVAEGVMRVSTWTRRLQHGHLHSYIFYLVVGLAFFAALMLTAPSPAAGPTLP